MQIHRTQIALFSSLLRLSQKSSRQSDAYVFKTKEGKPPSSTEQVLKASAAAPGRGGESDTVSHWKEEEEGRAEKQVGF